MKKQHGFTLVEVAVVAPIMVLSIAVIISLLVNITLQLGAKNSALQLQVEAQSALFTIRDDISSAIFFQGKAQPDTYDANKPGGWNAINDNALLISEAAYTAPRQDPARQIVYKANTPEPCDNIASGENQFSTNTAIFFVSNKKLYARYLVPSQSGNCATTFRKQTCPANTATATCPPDHLIAENVKEYKLTYYTYYLRNNVQSEAPLTSVGLSDPRMFVRVTRADINLILEKLVNGETVSASAMISIKRYN